MERPHSSLQPFTTSPLGSVTAQRSSASKTPPQAELLSERVLKVLANGRILVRGKGIWNFVSEIVVSLLSEDAKSHRGRPLRFYNQLINESLLGAA